MIVTIGNEKGGVGKSTLAVNLAVASATNGNDVCLVDTDIQGTASSFIAHRSKDLPKVHCVQKRGDVFDCLKDLSTRYKEIIIDAGGQDSAELRSALVASDVVVVPFKASQIDLWAIERMEKLIARCKEFNRELRVKTVVAMAPSNPRIKETDEARELLSDFVNLDSKTNLFLSERKIFRDSFIEGKGVLEMPNEKAKIELLSIYKEIYGE